MSYKETNQTAITEAEKTYGKMRDVEDRHNPSEVINYLRSILGLGCAKCGRKNVSWNTFKFYNFGPDVTCYECQEKEKLGIK